MAAIAVFAKNFLPVLFNVFSSTSADHRPAVHRAITAFVRISEPAVSAAILKGEGKEGG